jgi:hypothetical protein
MKFFYHIAMDFSIKIFLYRLFPVYFLSRKWGTAVPYFPKGVVATAAGVLCFSKFILGPV